MSAHRRSSFANAEVISSGFILLKYFSFKFESKRGQTIEVTLLLRCRRVELKGESKVTRGQVEYELRRLPRKLMHRDKKKIEELKTIKPNGIEANLVFSVVDGEVEP